MGNEKPAVERGSLHNAAQDYEPNPAHSCQNTDQPYLVQIGLPTAGRRLWPFAILVWCAVSLPSGGLPLTYQRRTLHAGWQTIYPDGAC